MNSPQFSKPTPVAIGAVKADCPSCHAFLFVRAQGKDDEERGYLACAACGTVTSYSALLQRISALVSDHARQVLSEANGIRRAVRNAQVSAPVKARIEEFIASAATDSRIAIALLKGERLEYRVVNVAYAGIREGGVNYVGRTYRDVFPQAAELGAEERLRQVIETREPWQINGFETPIPGRIGSTWWDGECVPVASDGAGVDSVLVVNWEITQQKLARRALGSSARGTEEAL